MLMNAYLLVGIDFLFSGLLVVFVNNYDDQCKDLFDCVLELFIQVVDDAVWTHQRQVIFWTCLIVFQNY